MLTWFSLMRRYAALICSLIYPFSPYYLLLTSTYGTLIFFPQQGNSIHAQVYPPADELFRTRVKEGGVYTFSYFRVRASNIYFKPVENDQMLVFTKWTKVEEVLAVPPAFPVYAYSLASPE